MINFYFAGTWKKPYSWQAWPIFPITSEWLGPPRPWRSMTGMESPEDWTCSRFGRSSKGLMKLEGTWLTVDASSDIITGFVAAIRAICCCYMPNSNLVEWASLLGSWQREGSSIYLQGPISCSLCDISHLFSVSSLSLLSLLALDLPRRIRSPYYTYTGWLYFFYLLE